MGFSLILNEEVLEFGLIKTSSKTEYEERIKSILKDVETLIKELEPDVVVIESQYIDFRKISGSILKTV
jgi:Holliday junction resolvasome RuvABC endonuclease subunit